MRVSMKSALLALGLLLAAFPFPSAHAADCKAAITEKRVCAGSGSATVARAACWKAAMDRCKKGGVGAI